LFLARTLATCEISAAAELSRWLAASDVSNPPPSHLTECSRQIVRCLLSWLGDGVRTHAEKGRSLLGDRHRRVLAASCLQEFVKRDVLLANPSRHRKREVNALIDSFFGLDVEFRASDPDVGEPESSETGVEMSWQEKLAPPLPRYGCSDGAGPVPSEPSNSEKGLFRGPAPPVLDEPRQNAPSIRGAHRPQAGAERPSLTSKEER
jgi:hypothetical protein